MQISPKGLKSTLSQLDLNKQANFTIQQIDSTDKKWMYTGAISNNLKLLKIWKYNTNVSKKSILFSSMIICCNFTDDSQLLYVGIHTILYQFNVNNQFKKLSECKIIDGPIYNFYTISNTIILIQSYETLIKMDVNKKIQLLKIQVLKLNRYVLDYNRKVNIIAGVSNQRSIKLWNGDDGSQIIQKLNAHEEYITQVLFIVNNDQLISLDHFENFIVWNVDYVGKQIDLLFQIMNTGKMISLVLQQQFILTVGKKFIKLYQINGEFVRQFSHQNEFFVMTNTITNDSMKAVLIQGEYKLQVFKLDIF
ncbi:hypothetical protein pb186bvf_014727 [Paramecium bursaria]